MTRNDRAGNPPEWPVAAFSGPVVDVNGTDVPIAPGEAHALGYLRGYADGREDGRLVGLDAARDAVAALKYADPYPALAAIDALREVSE